MRPSQFTVALNSITIALLTGLAIVPTLSLSALAQSTPPNAIQDLQTQDGPRDPFSNRGNPQGGLYDLIHQAQMGNLRNIQDFNADQQEVLDDETARFRAAQQERLRQKQGATSTPTVPQANGESK